MKKKQYPSPIIMVICIILLAIPIVCPPLFRYLYPVDDEIVEVINYSYILNCSRDIYIDNYKVSYKTTYDNGVPTNLIGSFVKTEYSSDEIANANPDMVNFETELNIFKNYENIVINENNGSYNFNLTEELLPPVENDNGIRNYYKSTIEEQEKFYEDNGYVCSRIDL